MQTALENIALLSITQYCSQSQKYANYFSQIEAFMPPEQISEILFKNIFTALGGNKKKVQNEVNRFYQTIEITTQNKINRIRLITQSDALINSLVRSMIPIQLITINFDSLFDQFVNTHFIQKKDLNIMKQHLQKFNQEHQSINQLLSQIKKEIKKPQQHNIDLILSQIHKFYLQLKKHFKVEELFFSQYPYHFADFHRQSHQDLLTLINEFLALETIRNKTELERFMIFIDSLISEHITELDHDYFSYYQD